ncbi:M24 family metallopeptidase [Tepidibacillus infernus]|uniref:M24 family metallopeptidase n=1 Tax=Tepidibacillus infernus TaxID=1806172 RepID=UPI003B735CDD
MEKRIERLRKTFKDLQIEGMLITSASNRRYISGFTGSAGYVLITQKDAIFITDFRYVDQAKNQAASYEIIQHQGSIVETVNEQLKRLSIQVLGFEQDFVTYSLYKQFEETFVNIELKPISQVIEKLRMIKDPNEVALIRKAAEIADQAFSYILTAIKPGMKETDVAFQLECKMRELGAEGASFDTIIASGYRSAMPHGVASDKVIQSGDLVTMDFGAIYQGYVSDITRTIIMGTPNQKQKEIYQIVLEAQLNGVQHVKAGMSGKEADALTRDIISKFGYGEYFGHSTGHGIGLDVHEGPGLSFKSDIILQPGMVVTVEPGIYITDFGGVRIEDDVLITDHGREIITQSTKELLIID